MHRDADVVAREELRHNPLNEVTASVERVSLADGRTLVRKQLRAPAPPSSSSSSSDPWAASDDPRHWNSWRREADVHRDAALRTSLRGTGLDLPACEVAGVPGERFELADHAALAAGLGRWQAQGPLEVPWASTGYLREYSGSRRALWHLLDDDDAWAQPLVRETWPAGLREVRLGVHASCVKYAWLLPLLLERAGAAGHAAYHRPADAQHLYAQRGLALRHLVGWCDAALAAAERR